MHRVLGPVRHLRLACPAKGCACYAALTIPVTRFQTPKSASSSSSSGSSNILSELNPEQLAAVTCDAHAVRVKAGPGSGKTRVVAARVARLISQGCAPSSILVITFTRRAAGELKERITKAVGAQAAAQVTACTFHSICCRILRSYVTQLGSGLSREFVILDPDESVMVYKHVLHEVVLPMLKTSEVKSPSLTALAADLHAFFSLAKSSVPTTYGIKMKPVLAQLLRAKKLELPNNLGNEMRGILRQPDTLATLLEAYQRKLTENDSIDLDDLLGLAVALVQGREGVRAVLQSRYRHVMVDEFQDTNTPQYELVRLLKGPQGNLFTVGDPDQAIYGWRGANPVNMEHVFQDHYPDGQLLYLTTNYRSGANIIRTAEAVLAHNGLPKLHKPLVAMKPDPGHVEHVTVRDAYKEAQWVAQRIRRLHQHERVPLSQCAVLYRTKAQAHLMSNALLDEGLPFRVLGNLGFWERLEVKDLLAFLRLAANPCTDSMALDRIIAKPARAIGAKAKESLRKCAAVQDKQLSRLMFDDLHEVWLGPLKTEQALAKLHTYSTSELSGKLRPLVEMQLVPALPPSLEGDKQFKSSQAGLHELRAAVVLMRNAARYLSLEAAVDVAMLGARYAAYCDDEGGRLERIDQLKRLCSTPSAWLAATPTLDHDDSTSSLNDSLNIHHSNSPGASDISSSPCDPSLPMLRAFLEHAQLLHDDQPESSEEPKGSKGRTKQNPGEQVQLMTLHASKGMEYEVVFVLGLEEDLLPSSMHQNVQGALDEEKRLAYVGCTRAKQSLYLLTAQERAIHGKRGDRHVSRFVSSIRKIVKLAQRAFHVKWTHC
ncbi:P-loop containing nucleoside triphosphate hydrolase protein [Haematococcus lacustris]